MSIVGDGGFLHLDLQIPSQYYSVTFDISIENIKQFQFYELRSIQQIQ